MDEGFGYCRELLIVTDASGGFSQSRQRSAPQATCAGSRRSQSARSEWVVYAKRPFAVPEAVLAYLSRYTHCVAISNSRLISHGERGVMFRWKDYRATAVVPRPLRK